MQILSRLRFGRFLFVLATVFGGERRWPLRIAKLAKRCARVIVVRPAEAVSFRVQPCTARNGKLAAVDCAIGCIAILLIAVGTAGCQRQSEVPPGYFEECWGGKERYYDPTVTSTPILLITIPSDEPQWPALRDLVSSFAAQEELKFIDTSVSRKDVRMVELFACSGRGVRVYATQRIWDPPIPTGLPEDRMDINVHCYVVSEGCAALARRLEGFVRERWPEVLQVRYREAVPKTS